MVQYTMNFLICVLILSLSLTVIENVPINEKYSEKYLENYGYMSKKGNYKDALKNFQKTYSLPVTGVLDDSTTKQMTKPRCGKTDKYLNLFKRNPWGKNKITYKFRSFPRNGLHKTLAIKEISRAFNLWSKYIPVKFELRQEGPVDIDVNFLPAHKGDGVGNTLAYAYYPRVGDIYFDEEPWTVNSYYGTNLFNTAAHEIGHSLGLEHSKIKNALMSPYIFQYDPYLGLFPEDIYRIQSLYGKKTTAQMTNICNITKIDATFYSSKENALFLIKDNLCWKSINGKIQTDYPKEIAKEWPEIPAVIDAAYFYHNDVYFAKDTTIWKYDGKVNDYLTLLKRINAAEIIGDKLHLFSDSEMWLFDISKGNQILEHGFPKSISSYWKGGPTSVDAIYYDSNKYFYLFKDSTVYKFNTNRYLINKIPLNKWLSC